jgi:hypothetical protein
MTPLNVWRRFAKKGNEILSFEMHVRQLDANADQYQARIELSERLLTSLRAAEQDGHRIWHLPMDH